MGLWIVQECRRQWQREGTELNYNEITNMAEKAEPFAAYINPDDTSFFAHGDMPKRVNLYLEKTNQNTIDDKGQLIRIVLESLAFRYKEVIEKAEAVTNTKLDCIHIVGGGIQNELLCQFTANATGKQVITGPIEATAIGNILMQAKAIGQIESLADARKLVIKSVELKKYQPKDAEIWQQKYEKFAEITGK